MSDGWAPYLDPDERIVWEGQPSRALFVFRGFDLFLVPFSIVWGLGGFTAFGASLTGQVPWPIGLLFGAAAFYITIGRFILSRYVRVRTRYALSTKRAFIARSAWGRTLMDQPIHADLPLSFKASRQGTVTFGPTTSIFSNQASMAAFTGEDGSFTFQGLSNAEEIYAMANRIKRGEQA